jgi:hypothetical protein
MSLCAASWGWFWKRYGFQVRQVSAQPEILKIAARDVIAHSRLSVHNWLFTYYSETDCQCHF